MRPTGKLAGSSVLLPAVMGFVDGILTALTLAAGLLIHNGHSLTLGFAFRVAAAAFFSGAFAYFVARYADLRQELVHAERELSLASHGGLAVTRLGRAIIREALVSTLIASTAAFVGALSPLCVAVLVPRYHWAPIEVALIALALLGAALARMLYGRILRWTLMLIAGGALLTVIGVKLSIL